MLIFCGNIQSCRLTTKMGRVGTILESLGTHGLIKCEFNEPITQQDTGAFQLPLFVCFACIHAAS
jgi:hypothetical protein